MCITEHKSTLSHRLKLHIHNVHGISLQVFLFWGGFGEKNDYTVHSYVPTVHACLGERAFYLGIGAL